MKISRYLILLVVFAVSVRLLGLFWVVMTVQPEVLVYGDAIGYIELAGSLISGNGFAVEQNGVAVLETFRTPALPLLLAPFMLITNGIIFYAVILSVIAGIALPLLTYFIARRMGSGELSALIAATLVAFEPHLIMFSWLPLTEMPFILFFLGGLALILNNFTERQYSKLFAGGVMLGFGALLRPGFWPIYVVLIIVAVLWNIVLHKRKMLISIACITLGIVVILTPWFMRMHKITGEWSLSGAGWRNVYTDYLASVRAIDNKTSFSQEKELLKTVDASKLGLTRTDLNNPANSEILRNYALAELWERRATVFTFEPYLLVSFFTHDGYYYAFKRYGFVQEMSGGESHSVSFALLSQGMEGVSSVFKEMKRQYFIPVLGRMFTFGTVLFALWGVWLLRRKPLTWLFVLLISLVAVTSTVIGLGVESRLRLPIEPLLFIFVAIPLAKIYSSYAHRHLHSSL